MVQIIFTLLIVSFANSCQGQSKPQFPPAHEERVYASVPPSDRESLGVALERFVGLQTACDWKKLYNRLDNQRKLSNEQFSREMQGNKLARFVPQAATFIPPEGTWMITGCGFFEPKQAPNGKGIFSSVHARKVGNGWRFTPVAIVILKDEPNGMRTCVSE